MGRRYQGERHIDRLSGGLEWVKVSSDRCAQLQPPSIACHTSKVRVTVRANPHDTTSEPGCSQLHLRAAAFSGLDAHSDGQRPYFTSPHPFRPLAVAGRLGLNGTMLG